MDRKSSVQASQDNIDEDEHATHLDQGIFNAGSSSDTKSTASNKAQQIKSPQAKQIAASQDRQSDASGHEY
eukprot:2769639-Karenia_brevis.AAC.1